MGNIAARLLCRGLSAHDARPLVERTPAKRRFFTGYGRTPSDREWLQANQVLLIHAIISVPWAIDHGDLEYERFNWVVIERLKKVL